MNSGKNRKDGRRSFWSGLIVGVFMVLIVGCGYFGGKYLYRALVLGQPVNAPRGAVMTSAAAQKIDILEEMIGEYYLEDVEPAKLEQGLYRGVVDALGDPYSVYYSPEELEELQNKTQGIYYGIGAKVGLDPDTQLARITGVIEDSPAQEAGLMANDLIYMVDGESVQGMDLNSIVAKVKGDEGTKVHLTVIREGENDYLEFDVTRRKLNNETVVYEMLEDRIGYILIEEFDDVTVDQFTDALATCKGSGMAGLVLDLRGNPGGNMDAVCEIARMLLPEGLIVYTEDKNGQREEYTCDGAHQLECPLVVLVDGNSASASEILAGAVKDYGIGTLVGTTTFGKGIVQRIMRLSDGSAVKLTVSKYYTPKGHNIHKIGIEPDIEVPFEPEPYQLDGTDNQLNRALEVLKEKMG